MWPPVKVIDEARARARARRAPAGRIHGSEHEVQSTARAGAVNGATRGAMSAKREYMPWNATVIVVGAAVAVLGDDQVGLARARVVALVGALAVQQDHDVGVLLERARLTQVGERRLLVGALLGTTVQLRQRDDRHVAAPSRAA